MVGVYYRQNMQEKNIRELRLNIREQLRAHGYNAVIRAGHCKYRDYFWWSVDLDREHEIFIDGDRYTKINFMPYRVDADMMNKAIHLCSRRHEMSLSEWNTVWPDIMEDCGNVHPDPSWLEDWLKHPCVAQTVLVRAGSESIYGPLGRHGIPEECYYPSLKDGDRVNAVLKQVYESLPENLRK